MKTDTSAMKTETLSVKTGGMTETLSVKTGGMTTRGTVINDDITMTFRSDTDFFLSKGTSKSSRCLCYDFPLRDRFKGFVCAAYASKGITIKTIPELRWHLFTKHMAESDKLPPTIGALKQHILRVHIQARVWGQAAIAHQDAQLDPLENGYFKDADGRLKPTTTDVLPAPKAIVEMVRCQCKADCSSARCSCRTKNLTCTDLCQCGSQCQNDEDSQNNAHLSDDEDEDDDNEDIV
ncbi:hypothetical protein ACOMHN_047127 [Nucella lapillus]